MKNTLLILFILGACKASAQQFFFNQHANAPLSQNPANTGLLNSDYRAVANYSNDWNSVTVPYVTSAISCDTKLFQDKLKKSFVGIGILGRHQMAGDGTESSIQLGVSLAYHRILNNNEEIPCVLSIGVQATQIQKKGFLHTLYFPLPTAPIPITPQPSGAYIVPNYLDYHAGLMYSAYLNSRLSFYSGFSYFHLGNPMEDILGTYYRVRPKYRINMGGANQWNGRWKFFFSSMYQQQGDFYDVLVGSAAAYDLSGKQKTKHKKVLAYCGAWYRHNNSLIPYFALEWNKLRISMNSNIKVSNLTQASREGGFELALIYNGCFGSTGAAPTHFAVPQF